MKSLNTKSNYYNDFFFTYSCRSKIYGSPFPPPDYPAPPARMRSSQDHRSCCEHAKEGESVKSAILGQDLSVFFMKRGHLLMHKEENSIRILHQSIICELLRSPRTPREAHDVKQDEKKLILCILCTVCFVYFYIFSISIYILYLCIIKAIKSWKIKSQTQK